VALPWRGWQCPPKVLSPLVLPLPLRMRMKVRSSLEHRVRCHRQSLPLGVRMVLAGMGIMTLLLLLLPLQAHHCWEWATLSPAWTRLRTCVQHPSRPARCQRTGLGAGQALQ
jgi:hypothetical protein